MSTTAPNPGIQTTGNPEVAKLKALATKIQTSGDIPSVLTSLIDELKDLLGCEALTLYSLDRENRQLVSRNHISDDVPELRVNISPKSLAGFVAATGKTVRVANCYDKDEMAKLHPQLAHGSSWDEKLNFKSKAIIALPLPFQKKLIGVLEVINKKSGDAFSDIDFKLAREISPAMGLALAKLGNGAGDVAAPKKQIPPQERLHSISQAIHSAKNIDEILIEFKNSILELFDATSITIYAVDPQRNEIYSKVKSGDTVNEFRVPISPDSISGWVATTQKVLNIEDVYDEDELKSHDPPLVFDSSWDKKTNTRSKSMLVCPLLHNDQLMGVMQLINKKSGERFTAEDAKNATIMTEVLALAFFNQSKYVQQKPTKFSHLINNGIITEEEQTQAISKARKTQVDVENILLEEFGVQRADFGKSLELFYGIPYYGYSDTIMLNKEILVGLNKTFLVKNFWLPLQADAEKVTILTNDPNNPDKIQNINLIFPKKKIEFKVALKADIIDFLNSVLADGETLQGVSEVNLGEMSSLLSALKDEQEETGESSENDGADEANAISETDSTIVRLVNKVLIDAYEQGVSDIHIEPGIGKKNMRVRFRKDGVCKVFQEIPYLYKQAFISRIKIMSKLDIAEKRLPQDGKIKMKYGNKEIEYRVATCPTVGGNEDAVLRILAASKPIPLEDMNFSPHNLALVQDKVIKPYGLILVVGPTGSGKTTTLHSCLGFINTPEIKIWTAEDPVEITQKGLRQVQMLNKIGLDFARAMRSFLRGDPDVIMVGEMRDSETCSIGLEASLTGHLVFSTLHTNSAPETITRLLDMGMNPLNFADAILLILAQRLVRTLCTKCNEDYHPSREEFDIRVRE
ncbi:MAG: Flp pilus assembly complex ATPase component TadA, partial [Nitrospinae bacterium]|nr:Flp pilus assembly complex ATPase component TadA [Nitrospinota bacterium]